MLELQRAQQGSTTDPKIITEIEDLQRAIAADERELSGWAGAVSFSSALTKDLDMLQPMRSSLSNAVHWRDAVAAVSDDSGSLLIAYGRDILHPYDVYESMRQLS